MFTAFLAAAVLVATAAPAPTTSTLNAKNWAKDPRITVTRDRVKAIDQSTKKPPASNARDQHFYCQLDLRGKLDEPGDTWTGGTLTRSHLGMYPDGGRIDFVLQRKSCCSDIETRGSEKLQLYVNGEALVFAFVEKSETAIGTTHSEARIYFDEHGAPFAIEVRVKDISEGTPAKISFFTGLPTQTFVDAWLAEPLLFPENKNLLGFHPCDAQTAQFLEAGPDSFLRAITIRGTPIDASFQK